MLRPVPLPPHPARQPYDVLSVAQDSRGQQTREATKRPKMQLGHQLSLINQSKAFPVEPLMISKESLTSRLIQLTPAPDHTLKDGGGAHPFAHSKLPTAPQPQLG